VPSEEKCAGKLLQRREKNSQVRSGVVVISFSLYSAAHTLDIEANSGHGSLDNIIPKQSVAVTLFEQDNH
jgi:hypothetical protein